MTSANIDPATSVPTWTRSAVLVQANHFQFGAEEDLWVRVIGSRMLLWGISGRGTITTNGLDIAVGPGALAVLPWRSDVHYRADSHDPFLTGAAHLVPWHDPAEAVEPRAGHGSDDPLNLTSVRQDRDWPGFSHPHTISERAARPIIRLGEAAVDLFATDTPDEATMRAFGLLLTRAIAREPSVQPDVVAVPPILIRMQEYVRSHLGQTLSARVLADVTGYSVSTVERQFRTHLGVTPGEWIRTERMSVAARSLRTSSRPITQIAAAVGFSDPLHFSRVFRRQYNVAPSRYAQRVP